MNGFGRKKNIKKSLDDILEEDRAGKMKNNYDDSEKEIEEVWGGVDHDNYNDFGEDY